MSRFATVLLLFVAVIIDTSYTSLRAMAVQLQKNVTFLPINQLSSYDWNEAELDVSLPASNSTLPHFLLHNVPLKSGDSEFRLGTNQPLAHNTKPFQIVNEWKYLDFEYPTYVERQRAIANGEFVPENNLPLGIDFYGDRLFVTTPRWKDGVPASFGYLPYPPVELSPAIRPYPNWQAHGAVVNQPDCSKLISVYRTSIDVCGRIWLIDSGVVNATIRRNQICPPKIIAYVLARDKQVVNYELPDEIVKQDSLHSNILADVQQGRCKDAHVYVTDVWRFGLVVYSLGKNRSWRITNYHFNPSPTAANFNVYGLNFQWLDGVFGLSLSPEREDNKNDDRILYFHPMASFTEFAVSTSLLRNENIWLSAQDVAEYFVPIGDRGPNGQSSSMGITRNGIMFYTQVHRDTVNCWNVAKPYVRSNLAEITGTNTLTNQSIYAASNSTRKASSLIQFPNDLTVDQETVQSIWVMSNRLPIYLYDRLDYSEINFRILRADAENAIKGTVCEMGSRETHIRKITTVQLYEGQCF